MKKKLAAGRANFSVRRFKSSDLEACRALWRQLAEKHAEIYSDKSIAREGIEDCFDEHLKKIGPKMVWVATVNSRVVGFVGLMISPDSDEDREIEPLVVQREFRGKGIGRALVEEARREAVRQGVKYFTVRPVARNKEALEFFRGEGFDKIGRVELFADFTGKKWEKGLKLHDLDFEF